MNTPAWAREPFSSFIDYHERIHSFYHLTVDGLGIIIHSSQRLEELTRELEELDHRQIEDDGTRKAARLRAEKAKWEVDNGFPTLHEQQIVALWTSLECLIEDFLIAWMANTPSSMQLDDIRKVRISISDYQQMQDLDRYHYLLGELGRTAKSAFRRGCDKFEEILSFFGLSGQIEASVKRNLFELESARNVLLHRRGIVDHRFIQACPWIKAENGAKLIIGREHFERYSGAVFDYSEIVLKRVKAHFASISAPGSSGD